jgi:hypothetical protein
LLFILGVSPDMLAEPVTDPTATPTSQDKDKDLEDFDEDGTEEVIDETDGIDYLYECTERLETSSLSSDHQQQLKDLSYASIMLHTHKDISM